MDAPNPVCESSTFYTVCISHVVALLPTQLSTKRRRMHYVYVTRHTLGRQLVDLLPLAQRTETSTQACMCEGLRQLIDFFTFSPTLARACVIVLVRWAKGKRLTNHSPTQSKPCNIHACEYQRYVHILAFDSRNACFALFTQSMVWTGGN